MTPTQADDGIDPSHRVFLVIATGQAVANLPPLLHAGMSGDQALWLWNDLATVAAAERCCNVLQGYGIDALVDPDPMPVGVWNFEAWWRRRRLKPDIQGKRVMLIGNGGTKPMSDALQQALGDDLEEVVYAEGKPVSVLRIPAGRATQARREQFVGQPICLQDVLSSTGHVLFDEGGSGSTARLLWKNGRQVGRLDEPLRCFLDQSEMDGTYSGPVDLRQRAWLGRSFEAAVAHRVLLLLGERRQWHGVVAEVWLGVKIARHTAMVNPAADWDVLLLLRNGVLLNIECKSLPQQDERFKKDMDARWQMMREGGSSLAVMWLCGMLPTALADRNWFRRLHEMRDEAAWLDRPHLAWTLPGQPRSYWFDGNSFEVPTFEAQLEELLAPYV